MASRNMITFWAALGLLWASSTVTADAKVRHAAGTHARTHDAQRGQEAARFRRPRVNTAHHGQTLQGKASVYAESLRGRKMADGTRFEPGSNAAASKTLPLGTTARVRNLRNGRVAIVKIRDRGPHSAGRIIDVSPGSANTLGMRREGVAPVAVTPLRSATSD
jgi:rare lipoprotein A